MTRNLKALGPMLFAAFAMSAMTASAAWAGNIDHTFHTDGKVVHLTAKAEGLQLFKATAGNELEVTCSEVNVHGTIEGTKTTETDYSTTEVTVEPVVGGCKVKSGTSEVFAKVTTNGCHYTFTHETAEGGGTAGKHAAIDLTCPEGVTGITVDFTALNTACLHIPGGQTLHGVRYSNIEAGGVKEITLETTVSGIKTETTNHVICPTASGQTETHEGGTYTGKAIVTGFKEEIRNEKGEIIEHKVPTNIWTTEAETP